MRTSRAELCGGWVQWGKTVYEDPEYFSVIDSYIIDFRLGNILQLLNIVLWKLYCENAFV